MGIYAENILNGVVERNIRRAMSVARKRPFTRAILFNVTSVMLRCVKHVQKVTTRSARTARRQSARRVWKITNAKNSGLKEDQ